MRPRVVAHRGASALYPENTLTAFEMAKTAGADAIELDIHQTTDGGIVVVHGFDLSRTTDGVGLVHEVTTDYVRSLDAGSWWSPDFSGERVPLLTEVLALDEIHFEIELKGHGKQFVENVITLVNDHAVLDRVEFTSFHLVALCELRRQEPHAQIGLFARQEPYWTDDVRRHLVLADRDLLDAAVVHVPASDFDPDWVDACHESGAAAYAANDGIPRARVAGAGRPMEPGEEVPVPSAPARHRGAGLVDPPPRQVAVETARASSSIST